MEVEKLPPEAGAPSPAPSYRVNVALTLTAPGCGMGPAIAEDAKSKILLVPGVSAADVRITWDPPWNQSMISEEGKMKLGLI
jgi:metal-sulfur cluster biosynthetic enzyme